MTAATVTPDQTFEPSPAFMARIKALAESIPASDEPVPEVDGIDAQRRKVDRDAWTNSLRMARLDDKAGWSLDDLADDQHPAMLRRYVDGLGPDAAVVNLVLGGRIGSGKTTAAVALGDYASSKGLRCRVVRHKHYLDWLRPDGAPEGMTPWQVRRRMRDCDLLVLDELGGELDGEASRFVREETLSLIGDRIEAGKATVFTTNDKPDTIAENLGQRLMSRISERGLALTVRGDDRRGRLHW